MHLLKNKGGREDCVSRLPAECLWLIAQKPTKRWAFMHLLKNKGGREERVSRLPAECLWLIAQNPTARWGFLHLTKHSVAGKSAYAVKTVILYYIDDVVAC